MRIGIDARPLQHETQYRGIGKALQFLLMALKDELGPKDSVSFYIDEGLPEPLILKEYQGSHVIKIPTSKLGRKRYVRSVLPSFRLINPSPSDIDVLLQYDASFGVPAKVPTVVVFHDLIPYLFRGQEKQRPVKGLRKTKDALARGLYWKKYLRVWKQYGRARKIIPISNSSKVDLLKFIPNVKERDVEVIYHGVSQSGQAGQPSPEARKLASKPFLIYAGGIDFRKNILGLLESFFEVKKSNPDLRLIMVGKEFELQDQLQGLGWFSAMKHHPEYAKDVLTPGFISDDDLKYLLQQAVCLAFPSRYEGFGLPILEAMAAGCPVIAYRNSSIPEVAGGAAILVEDGASLVPAIEKILNNPKMRKELIAKGKTRATNFSWGKTAQHTLRILQEAAKK